MTPWRSAPYFTRGGMSGGRSAPGKRRAVDVPPPDRRAVPTAHPAVPIAEVVLRATAGTRLVIRRRGRAARAEPSGPVLLPPESAAPVEAPGAVEAAVIGRDVAGGRAALVLAGGAGCLRCRRAPRRHGGFRHPHGRCQTCTGHDLPYASHIIDRPSRGAHDILSVVWCRSSPSVSGRTPDGHDHDNRRCAERTGTWEKIGPLEAMPREAALHPLPRTHGEGS